MSENLRNYVTAVHALEHAIRAVPAGAWTEPSPCEGWTARDVAGHALGVIANVAARAGVGELCDPFANPGALAGDDPYETARSIRHTLLEALDQPGALQLTVEHRIGTMSLDRFVGMMLGDCVIHTWDITRATGGDERLDPALVPVVHAALQAQGETLLRSPGRFAPATAAAESTADEQSQLLAFAGRRP